MRISSLNICRLIDKKEGRKDNVPEIDENWARKQRRIAESVKDRDEEDSEAWRLEGVWNRSRRLEAPLLKEKDWLWVWIIRTLKKYI